MSTEHPRIEMVPVSVLRPYARNARTHSRKQVSQIADSIRRFGFTNPVLVSDDGEIVAGHGRVMAAKQLGMADVPVLRLSHLTPDERRAYVLADNKLALNAGWDSELLGLEMQALIDLVDRSRRAASPDVTLLKLVRKAHHYLAQLTDGSGRSISDIAEATGVDRSDVGRALRLAFLAPSIIDRIVAGTQPADLTAHRLSRLPDLPLSWSEQGMLLGR